MIDLNGQPCKLKYNFYIYICGINGCESQFGAKQSLTEHRRQAHSINDPVIGEHSYSLSQPSVAQPLPKLLSKKEWKKQRNRENHIAFRKLNRKPPDTQAKEIIINLKNYFEIYHQTWSSSAVVEEIARATRINISSVHRVIDYFNKYKELPPSPPIQSPAKPSPKTFSKTLKSIVGQTSAANTPFVTTEDNKTIIMNAILRLNEKKKSFGVDDIYKEIKSSLDGRIAFNECNLSMFRKVCRKTGFDKYIKEQVKPDRQDPVGVVKKGGFYLCNQVGCVKRFRDTVALRAHLTRHRRGLIKSHPTSEPSQTQPATDPIECQPSTSSAQPPDLTNSSALAPEPTKEVSNDDNSSSVDDQNIELKNCCVSLKRIRWADIQKYLCSNPNECSAQTVEGEVSSLMNHMLDLLDSDSISLKMEPMDTSDDNHQTIDFKQEFKTENFWHFYGDVKPSVDSNIQSEEQCSVGEQSACASAQSLNIETSGTIEQITVIDHSSSVTLKTSVTKIGASSDQTEEQQFACPIDGCGKVFADRDSLSIHCHWIHRRPLPDLNAQSSSSN